MFNVFRTFSLSELSVCLGLVCSECSVHSEFLVCSECSGCSES